MKEKLAQADQVIERLKRQSDRKQQEIDELGGRLDEVDEGGKGSVKDRATKKLI